MNDMSGVIIPRSDQLNSDSLLAGPITITITKVEIRPGTEQPVSVFYDGDDGRPWKPCKSMCRCLVHCWGADANQYIGKSLTLYNDPKVKWGGMAVGGIRISHMSHIDSAKVMALTETKGSKKPFTVKPLVEAPAADGPEDFLDRANRELDATKSNASAWLAAVIALTVDAPTISDLTALRDRPGVRTAEATAPPHIKQQIAGAFATAILRLTPVANGQPIPADDGEGWPEAGTISAPAVIDPKPDPHIPDATELASRIRACATQAEVDALYNNPAVRKQLAKFTPAAVEIVETARGERGAELGAG